jgi:hypothetical protein
MERLILPDDIRTALQEAPFKQVVDLWQSVIELFGARGKAALGRADRFYLLTMLLNRVDAFHPWLYERCREVEAQPDECLDLWSREHYKAVAIDYPVPTPNGWTLHGDLGVGDEVYGPDGNPCRVVATTPVWRNADCYRVTTDDGHSVTVSGAHLWTVLAPYRERLADGKRGRWKLKTVDTVTLRSLVEHSADVVSRGRVSIPVADGIVGKEFSVPVDPYVIGAWLGDGACGGSRITAGIEDADEIQQHLEETGISVHRANHSNAVSLRVGSGIRGNRLSSEFTTTLRNLGIFREKRIPQGLFRAAIEQRWALLQGLMDTDGSCKVKGQCMFVSASELLAQDVYDLCITLGIKPTIYRRTAKYKGGNRQYWQVQFRGCMSDPPFRMRRKRERCSPFNKKLTRKIVSVEPVESAPVSCIQVDRKDGLYLIGKNFLTTHNSTIITYAGIIQEVLREPNVTVAIFSHVRPIATKFLGQIKYELETNEELKTVYPDVLWADPKRDALRAGATWTQYRIDVKRTQNPKEGTVEAWGLVDGQPTGAHFALRVYDDVVTRESVTTPEMVAKTTQAWELSDNLGSRGADGKSRRWHIGTRYHFSDTYGEIIERGILKPRIYPATEDGTLTGKPVFLPQHVWEEKKITQRTQIAAQMLQNPAAGNEAMFRKEDLRFIDIRPATLNVYIMVDPASSKKKAADSTVMAVIGVDAARNKYLLDGYRQKMNLQERWTALLGLRRKWVNDPGTQAVHVGYERFGMRSDMEYFEEQMQRNGAESFPILELAWPQDGPGSKFDRIQRLVPDFGQGKFYLPQAVTREVDGKRVAAESARQAKMRAEGQAWRVLKPVARRDHEGQIYSLTKMLLDEYLVYPFAKHDDFLDACSRIYDMDYQPPVIVAEEALLPEVE